MLLCLSRSVFTYAQWCQDGGTVLQRAALDGSVEILEELLEANAEINLIDEVPMCVA